MKVFWKRGFGGTSVRDLVEACGFQTRSMYDAFGGKEHFFAAALDHYYEKVLAPILARVALQRGLPALERFARGWIDDVTPDGCLILNTGAERNGVASSALDRVARYTSDLRGVVRDKLEEAREDGEFRGDADARANQFCVSLIGFTMAIKCGLERPVAACGLELLLIDLARDR